MAIVKLSEQLPRRAVSMLSRLHAIATDLAAEGRLTAASAVDYAAQRIRESYRTTHPTQEADK